MTNAQKYTRLAEQEIENYRVAHEAARVRHEEAVNAGEADERYFENVFYIDEAGERLLLAKIYAQLACVPEPVIVGEVPFEEAAQQTESPGVDPNALVMEITRALPGIIALIQSTERPSGRPPFRG